jgi:hypothetical protein
MPWSRGKRLYQPISLFKPRSLDLTSVSGTAKDLTSEPC